MAFLVLVTVPDLPLNCQTREEMEDTENHLLVWSDEIEVIDEFEVGEEVILNTFPSSRPASVNETIVDNDLNGLIAVIEEIFSEEFSFTWEGVHRPYIGELR